MWKPIFPRNLVCTILIVGVICTYCKSKNSTPSQISQNSKLSNYYKKNNWSYPIEIQVDSVQYAGNVDNIIQPDILKKMFLNWCFTDSNFKRHDSSVVISNIKLKSIDKAKFVVTCIVDFYSEGEIKVGLVAPVEGHGIIENQFLRQREFATLTLENNRLIFLNWQQ